MNGAGYLAYLLLTSSGLSPRLTVTVLLSVSLRAAFRLYGRVTFAVLDRVNASGVRSLAISLTGFVLNLALLTVLINLRSCDVPLDAALRVRQRPSQRGHLSGALTGCSQ